jgi:hypothetical protein
VPRKAVPALYPLGLRRRIEIWDVIARFRVAGRKNFAGDGFLKKPFEGAVARSPQVGRNTRPVEMHINGKRRGRCEIGEVLLFSANFRERQATPTQLLRNWNGQIAQGAKLFVIFGEEAVITIV